MNSNPGNRLSIGALIINWNGAGHTIELIESLVKTCPANVDLDVAIVDNASKATDRRELEHYVKCWQGPFRLTLRLNSMNVGVPQAYNQAIGLVGPEHDFYLRLDNDVVMLPGGLLALVEAFKQSDFQKIAIAGGNIKYYSAPALNNGGATAFFLRRGRTQVTYPDTATECDGVLGCIMLISGDFVRSLLPEVFDSRLFICTDESELSLRGRRAGRVTWYVPFTVGLHKSGASTGQVSRLALYYSARNWCFLRLKYTTGFTAKVAVVLSILLGCAKRLAKLDSIYLSGSLSGGMMYLTECLDARITKKTS